MDFGRADADVDCPICILPIVPECDVLKSARVGAFHAHGAAKHPDMARSIDVVFRGDRAAIAEIQGINPVTRAVDLFDAGSLVHFHAVFGCVVEKNLVVDGAIDLKGGMTALSLKFCRTRLIDKYFGRNEFQIPKFRILPPSVG